MTNRFGVLTGFLLLLILTACQSQSAGPVATRPPTVQPVVVQPRIPSNVFNITDFGAVGDGRNDNTAAFARAMAACSAAGGGRVVVPAGTWFTGPIHLISNLDFHLDAGALILFSRKFDDYPLVVGNYEGQQAVICTSPLSGDQLHDLQITGQGIIDGQGDAWRQVKKSKLTPDQWKTLVKSGGFVHGSSWYPTRLGPQASLALADLRKSKNALNISDFLHFRPLLRPPLVVLSNCRDVLLEGPTFRNSPSWNIHLLYCSDVLVHSVTIFNPYYAQNGDGIDIDSCKDVTLTDDDIAAGDDVVCLKSGRDAQGRRVGRPTENVLVAHCRLGRGHGGIAIGSEMSGGVRNVEVFDCVLRGTDDALRFKTVRGRGGVVENINIHDIEMFNIKNSCIGVDMYYQLKKPATRPTTRARPTTMEFDEQPDPVVAKPLTVTQESPMPLDDGTPQFRDITIRNIVCHGANIALQLRGLPELPLQNVTIEHAQITSRQGGAIIDASGVTLRDVHIKSASVPCLEIQDATNLTLDDVDAVPQTLK